MSTEEPNWVELSERWAKRVAVRQGLRFELRTGYIDPECGGWIEWEGDAEQRACFGTPVDNGADPVFYDWQEIPTYHEGLNVLLASLPQDWYARLEHQIDRRWEAGIYFPITDEHTDTYYSDTPARALLLACLSVSEDATHG